MKLELNVINSNEIIDKYCYSLDEFKYNDKKLDVENKEKKLTHYISITSGWNDTVLESINSGFIVSIDLGKYTNKYVFSNDSLPDNFMYFLNEIKRLTLED